MLTRTALFLIATVLLPASALAAGMPPATIPASDSEVLEKVAAPSDKARREARVLRQRLAANPEDLATTLELARGYLELSRRDADPRYVGYAEALLAPWLSRARTSAELRVMYAIVLQATHRFPQAITELEQAIKLDSRNAQAWLTLASIRQVQGDFPAAKKACLGLATTLDADVATRCVAGVELLGREAPAAYARLSGDLRQGRVAEWERGALQVQLAESAARMGKDPEARMWFASAIKSNPDSYLKGAYADYLLDRKQYAEVISLLRTDQAADPLLLRLAEATRATGSSDEKQHVVALAARFEAARERGDTTHLREESRFELRLRGDTRRALELAKQNWEIQREPADARVLLEAAAQAKNKAAAEPVSAWLRENGISDVALQPLLKRLGAKS